MFNVTTLSSTIYSCCKVVQLFILLDSFVFLLVSSAKFCNVGRNANSKEALGNQSCLTNKTHLAESLLATEYRPDLHYNQKTHYSSSNLSKSSFQNCYIFRHILRENLPQDVKKESVHTRFSCDFEDVCKGKETNIIIDNVVLNGEMGELYCCEEDNCNAIEKIQTPTENRICYSGQSNASDVVLESCGHPDTYCMTRTLTDGKDRQVDLYSCDNYKACDNINPHGAYQFCHTSYGNFTEELCCCVTNQCNRPLDPSVILKGDNSHAGSISTTTWRRVIRPIGNPNATNNDESTTLVKGLVASIVMVALMGIIVLLVLAYRKRRRRDGGIRTDPNVIMQYERLSCSDASLEGLVSV